MNNQPECEIDFDGTKEWTVFGQLHRENGPAVEFSNGEKEWWLNGERHRENGPAYEDADGNKAWWLNNECVKPEDVVDYNLAKGIFCYYDEETQTLNFGEKS